MLPSSKEGSEVRLNRVPAAGRGLASCSGAVMHWHESFQPASHMLKDILSICSTRVRSSSATPYQLKQLELVILFTNSAVFRRCGWGINLIILQFALAQLILAERETLAAVLLGCLSLWSASQCESTDPTCPDRCTDSSGFLCENAFTSPSSLSLSVPIFCSGTVFVFVHLLVYAHAFLYTQHNPSLAPTGSAVWEDGGKGGWSPALQPVHGSKLNFTECSGPLSEADQWDFPQWGHEGHVRLIKIFLLHCPCSGCNKSDHRVEKIRANSMNMWGLFPVNL